MNTSKNFVLLGDPIAKSHWKELHEELSDEHDFFTMETSSIQAIRQVTSYAGYAITTPYKRSVMAHLDAFSLGAAMSQCVNTVQVQAGLLIGHDTDGEAVARLLGYNSHGKEVAILGNGPAAHSIQTRLENEACGCQIKLYTRSGIENLVFENSPLVADIVINATGSYELGDANHPLQLVHPHLTYPVFVELAYQGGDTPLLAQAKAAGARCYTGLDVLAKVVETQREIWGLSELAGKGK